MHNNQALNTLHIGLHTLNVVTVTDLNAYLKFLESFLASVVIGLRRNLS